MKKLIALIMIVLCVASIMCACGSQPASTNETNSDVSNVSSVDLSSVLNQINSTYGLNDLKQVEDTKKLKRYYEISEDDVVSFAAEFASDASTYCEVVIVEAKDADAAKRVSTALTNHLDAQISEAKSYSPESEEMLSNCKVNQSGNFVYLVVGENADQIQSDIAKSIG